MSAKLQYWLVKQEPTAYSWDRLVSDGRTAWTGVRNSQARKNLRSMRSGDPVLVYHSVIGKEIVGIAKVASEAYPDPTATEGSWVCVDLVPHKTLRHPVSLELIKTQPKLREMTLLRQARLSVQPVTPAHFQEILDLAYRGVAAP